MGAAPAVGLPRARLTEASKTKEDGATIARGEQAQSIDLKGHIKRHASNVLDSICNEIEIVRPDCMM